MKPAPAPGRTSWSAFEEGFTRTPEQAEADARELSQRAARQPHHQDRGRDRRQRRLQREAQRAGAPPCR